MIGADGQDVAGAAFPDAPAQVKVAVHLIVGDESRADAAVMGMLEQPTGQLRLGFEHDLVRTQASSRRSSSAAQSTGRHRARPIWACPAWVAQARVTATWHRAIPPRER